MESFCRETVSMRLKATYILSRWQNITEVRARLQKIEFKLYAGSGLRLPRERVSISLPGWDYRD